MTTADKITKLISQLVGDVSRLEGVQLTSASEAQLVQLLTDAMEAVGYIAIEEYEPVDSSSCNLRERTNVVYG